KRTIRTFQATPTTQWCPPTDRRRAPLRERRLSAVRRLLHRCRHRGKGRVQARADARHHGDDRHRDARGNETILNRSRARFISKKTHNFRHLGNSLTVPVLSGRGLWRCGPRTPELLRINSERKVVWNLQVYREFPRRPRAGPGNAKSSDAAGAFRIRRLETL